MEAHQETRKEFDTTKQLYGYTQLNETVIINFR